MSDTPRTDALWRAMSDACCKGQQDGFADEALAFMRGLEREAKVWRDMAMGFETQLELAYINQRRGADSPYVQASAKADQIRPELGIQTADALSPTGGSVPCEPEPTHIAQSAPATKVESTN